MDFIEERSGIDLILYLKAPTEELEIDTRGLWFSS